MAVGTVAVATAIGWPLVHSRLSLNNANVLMLYLLGVLWVATRHSRGAAVLASALSVLAFDVMFVPPYYRLRVEDEQYIITFAAMLVTALVISQLTHRVRVQSEQARQAWERVEAEFLRNTLLSGVSHELRTPSPRSLALPAASWRPAEHSPQTHGPNYSKPSARNPTEWSG